MISGKIYWDDIEELYIKLRQRGTNFILSKVNTNAQKRTSSSFSVDFEHANWWIIPALKKRFNYKICGDETIDYERYISEKYFKDKNIYLVSPGCGSGSHEMALAKYSPGLKILGYDISPSLVQYATHQAMQRNLASRCLFEAKDFTQVEIPKDSVDCFLFHSSLHHFFSIEKLLIEKVIPALKEGGLVVIHEYVGANRLQIPDGQLKECNRILLDYIPENQRIILGTKKIKSHCYRQGLWRMKINDPSECADAESIMPALRKHLKELHYTPLGGNIAMPVLKHIAHHFVEDNQEILQKIFDFEDEFLCHNDSDYAFGIFQKLE